MKGRLPALADARWPEIEAHDRNVLVVPLGSLEQHGPHLPLDTDAFLASACAEMVHAAHPDAGLAPTIAIGASGEHGAFPGTLSIGTPTLAQVLIELVRDACRTWRHVLVINGHGGNADALAMAMATCAYEGRSLRIAGLGAPGMDAHAGRSETSMMLHLAPERVRMDLAEPGVTGPVDSLRLRELGVRAVTPNGVLGDPTGANAEEGAALMTAAVDRLLANYDLCLGVDTERP